MAEPGLRDRLVARIPERLRGADGSRIVFLIGVGVLIGVLIGSILIPKTQDTNIRSSRSGAGNGSDETGSFEEGSSGEAAALDGGGDSAGGSSASGRGTTSGRRSGGTSGGPGSGGGPGGGGGSTSAGGGPARGVTDTKMRIGVALPDIEAFGAIDEDFDVGDQRAQMEAVLDGWRKDKTLPVHGRDIEFVYESFNILDPNEKVAACNRLIKDHRVFAVLAGRFFEAGADCVADRFDTPVVSVSSALDDFYARGAPFLFTLRTPWTKLFRNWVAWADANGHFAGRTVGLFFESEVKPSVEAGIKHEMAKRKIPIAAEVEAAGAGIGTSQDQVAVQRFQSRGVDLVMFVAGGTSAINFMTFAESQGYRPKYIDTDYGEHTTDAAAGAYPANQYDGTHAMTGTRVGEVAARLPLPAETTDCVDDYERFSGADVGPRSPESAEYGSVLIACDLADVMIRGLTAAGRGVNSASLIAGLESIRNMPLAVHGNLSYGPDRHWGVEEQRSVQWQRGCTCWIARSPQMQPYAV